MHVSRFGRAVVSANFREVPHSVDVSAPSLSRANDGSLGVGLAIGKCQALLV